MENSVFYAILVDVVILCPVFLYFFLLYDYRKRFTLFEKLCIPGPKPHFLIGNAFKISFDSKTTIKWLMKWQNQYGKIYGYYSGRTPALVVNDLELVKLIAIKDFDHFADRWKLPALTSTDNKSLFNTNGQRWFDVRRILSPTFSGSKLRHLTPILNKAVRDFDTSLKKTLEKDVDCDMYEKFRRLTLDAIGESALAMKINCQLGHSKFYDQIKSLNQFQSSKFLKFWFAFPEGTSAALKYPMKLHPFVKTLQYVVDNLIAVVKARKNLHLATSKKTVDMIQLMLDATAEAKLADMSITSAKPLEEDEVVANCFLFVFAGYDTTAVTMSYAAYMLATHPEVQEKALQEILDVVKDLENVTYDDVNGLHYLGQIVQETLRLYPLVPVLNRMCVKDYEYRGMTIPKGIRIDIPVYAIHHDPEVWPDPETFDPDRFSPENKANIHPAAQMPFGIGPRNCIGMRYALLEVKLALISLLSKYRLSLPSSPKLPPEQEFPTGVYHPLHGIYLQLERRN